MTVNVQITNSVAEVVLDRPSKFNAVNAEMAGALLAAIDEAIGSGCRALLLRGEGRGFCAGRDLGDANPTDEDAQAILVEQFNPLFQRLRAVAVPTIAVVQGPALGVGLGLAFACDVVFVGESAKVGSPFAGIGCVLDSGGHRHFVDRLGPHRALEMIYSGALISGRVAAELGLVNRCFTDDVLLAEARSFATSLASGPTAAFALSKQIVQRMDAEHMSFDDVLAAEAEAQGAASKTADYAEGIGAFQAKRQPTFTGK
jgi:2-(1,2-epoxy-1,2-dihydrophenyl)acetyl-CoA isomerase